MHELSVAMRIVQALEQELAPELNVHSGPNGLTVTAVTLQIGALSGLVPEALEFSWEMATDSSILKDSKLYIQIMGASGICANCQKEQMLTNLQSMRCPVCREPIAQITGGNELEILTVEISDD